MNSKDFAIPSTAKAFQDLTLEQKERIQKLIDALRSGKYTQVRNYLKLTSDDDGAVGHCCLGVAGEIYQQETGLPDDEVWTKIQSGTVVPFLGAAPGKQQWLSKGNHALSGQLDITIQNWFGLPAGMQTVMVNWNDSQKLGFDEIANRLERLLTGTASINDCKYMNGTIPPYPGDSNDDS